MLLAVVAPFFTTYLIRTLAWETILSDHGIVMRRFTIARAFAIERSVLHSHFEVGWSIVRIERNDTRNPVALHQSQATYHATRPPTPGQSGNPRRPGFRVPCKESHMLQATYTLVLSVAFLLLFSGCAPMNQTTPKVQQVPFGTTGDGTPVDVYTLSNTQGHARQDRDVRRHDHRTARARSQRNDRGRGARLRNIEGFQIQGQPRTSARRSADTRTGSPRASSRSTATIIRCRSTTARTVCTAGRRLRQSRVEGRTGEAMRRTPSCASSTSAPPAIRVIPARSVRRSRSR